LLLLLLFTQVGGVSTAELNRLELEMLQLLEFRLSVTPEQLVGVLLDAQSGRLVAQMAAAYTSACGMATAMDTTVMAVSGAADAAASSNVAGSVVCNNAQGAPACWEATSPAGACGLAAAAAAAAVNSAQQMAQLFQQQQQQQQQLIQQLAVVHRKRRSSVDMLDGSDFRPRAYHRASLEVVAMAQ
jgi:hypothetical protein